MSYYALRLWLARRVEEWVRRLLYLPPSTDRHNKNSGRKEK